MSLRATGGRIEIKSPSGEVVVDTNERLFIASNFITGSVVRPARSTSYLLTPAGQEQWTPIDVDVTVDLADIHSSAVAVVGSFKVTGTAAAPGSATQAQAANGVRNYGWFTAGGTYVHSAMPMYVFTGSAWVRYPFGLLSAYTFTAGGGKLRLHERTQGNPGSIVLASGSILLSQEEITIDYRLFVGTYV